MITRGAGQAMEPQGMAGRSCFPDRRVVMVPGREILHRARLFIELTADPADRK